MRQPPECLFCGLSTFKISFFFIKFRSNFHAFFDVSFWDLFFEILVRLGANKVDFGSPLAASWAPNGAQNRPKGAQNRPSGAKKQRAHKRRWHFFAIVFFFNFLVRLGAKKVDFGSPLAPSWSPNGAQNHPSGAKKSPKSCQKGPRTYNPSHCFAPLETNDDK